MRHSVLLLCLLFSLLPLLHSARILALLPMPIWSHYMQFEPLIEALATRGHQVTVYSPYPPKTNLTNLQHVHVKMDKSKEMLGSLNHFELKESGTHGDHSFKGHIESTVLAFTYGIGMVTEIFNDTAIQALMKSSAKFDLVFAELWFGQEALAVFGHKFRVPIVAEISYGTPHNVYHFMGNPNLYSYMPDHKLTISSRMNFLERLQNTILGVYSELVGTFWYYPALDVLMRNFSATYAPQRLPPPYITTLLQNVSATFIYSDPILEFPRAQVSNLIHVGGIHLKTGTLPKDLADLMSTKNSPRGVIYVSFGSLIMPSRMAPSMRDILVRAFSKTGLTVLWRWEGEAIENLPSNIHLRKWIPQQDVLAHPNCRLFISHGGVNSALETVHYGVPIVGVAFYGDQPSNIKRIIDVGAGLELSYFNITEESLTWATSTVLGNPSFKRNAEEASRRFNDRQTSPLHSAIWWVEYILRHHGAPHLRSAFDHLSWTEYLLLDVIALVLAVLALVIYLLLRIGKVVKSCVMYPFSGKQEGKGKKSKRE